MAQSRSQTSRNHSAVQSPSTSPRTQSEKKHHSRRKSGKDYVVTEKESSRPAPLSRRNTPQYMPTLRTSTRNHRERDEDSGRDSGESFPQFCMTCEKQFLSTSSTFLYCSEACRIHDQAPTQSSRNNSCSSSPPLTPYTRQFSSYPSTSTYDDGPDIIPRFSPTQSRPRSYFNSEPYPQTYQVSTTTYSTSPPQSDNIYTRSESSSALASLRELATALPRTNTSRREPESPPKSSASSITRTGSGVWDYIPFTLGSKTATPTPNATPGTSYGNGYAVSQSYSGYTGRSREDLHGYGKSYGTANAGGFGNTGGMGMDRPLPPRTGPSGYGHRPRSIDLVTPFSGH